MLSVDKWEQINEQLWETFSSLSWRENGWKNITRFFYDTGTEKNIKVQGAGD